MIDPSFNSTGTKTVKVPDGTDPADVVYLNWGTESDLPPNVVVLRRFNARDYLAAEAEAGWGRGRGGGDERTDHEWAASVIKGLVVSVDGGDPLEIDSRLLVPLASWSYLYSKGLGLRPTPSAQPED